MNLNIDGNATNISFKINAKDALRQSIITHLSANQDIFIHSDIEHGLIVIPSQLISFDVHEQTLTKHDNPDQFQYMIGCAVIAFDKVELLKDFHKAILLKYLADQKALQGKPEPKRIILLQ